MGTKLGKQETVRKIHCFQQFCLSNLFLSGGQLLAFTIKHILEIGQDALYTDEHDFYNATNTANFLSELI